MPFITDTTMPITVSNQEDSIALLFKKGFERAADSFSRMIRYPVSSNHTKTVVQSDRENHFSSAKGNLEFCVLTTQLIGQLPGKSYLVLSAEACQSIYNVSFPGRDVNKELQEGQLLELDNIISASVISELANALKVELYGDVPQLKRMSADQLTSYLKMDYLTQDQVKINIISSTTFTLTGKEPVQVQFIWKLSSEILESIAERVKTIL